jgi:hypothetical protein
MQQNVRQSALKKQEQSYSGKKKRHTIKKERVINAEGGTIICVAEAKGAVHDVTLFKESKLHMREQILLYRGQGLSGYSKHTFQ